MANISDKSGIEIIITDINKVYGAEGLSLTTNDGVEITDNANVVIIILAFIWDKVVSNLNLQVDKDGNSS